MICGSHSKGIAEIAKEVNRALEIFSVESGGESALGSHMISSSELLERLEKDGVKKGAIAEAIGIDPAGVTRLYRGQRVLSLDEARKLVDRFDIERPLPVNPLSAPIARLLILYAVDALGFRVDPADPRVEAIAQDIRAFSKFVADPRARENVEMVEAFLQGLRLAPGREGSPPV